MPRTLWPESKLESPNMLVGTSTREPFAGVFRGDFEWASTGASTGVSTETLTGFLWQELSGWCQLTGSRMPTWPYSRRLWTVCVLNIRGVFNNLAVSVYCVRDAPVDFAGFLATGMILQLHLLVAVWPNFGLFSRCSPGVLPVCGRRQYVTESTNISPDTSVCPLTATSGVCSPPSHRR